MNGARVDAAATTPQGTIVLAAASGTTTTLLELNATTGKELHRADLPALLYTEKTVTRVNLTTGATTRFALPGTLLDS
ncbi:hypothetical protein [Streptomyces sp. NPDC018693]|uniref:hypothetical protein n=1 Tax=unclassified Streptomyces TaxID=2593676 RepID=UPI0037AFD92D